MVRRSSRSSSRRSPRTFPVTLQRRVILPRSVRRSSTCRLRGTVRDSKGPSRPRPTPSCRSRSRSHRTRDGLHVPTVSARVPGSSTPCRSATSSATRVAFHAARNYRVGPTAKAFTGARPVRPSRTTTHEVGTQSRRSLRRSWPVTRSSGFFLWVKGKGGERKGV